MILCNFMSFDEILYGKRTFMVLYPNTITYYIFVNKKNSLNKINFLFIFKIEFFKWIQTGPMLIYKLQLSLYTIFQHI